MVPIAWSSLLQSLCWIWRYIDSLIPLIQIFGGDPHDLKDWNSRRKRGECLINKTTKNFLIKIDNNCKDYIVVDLMFFYKMWFVSYNIFQLHYHGSIPWVNEYHGWISQYHGKIPWVNECHGWMSLTIPWVDATFNTMGKFYGWMNTMGWCHFPFISGSH